MNVNQASGPTPGPLAVVSSANARHYSWESAGAPVPCEGWHLFASAGLSVIQERIGPRGAERNHLHLLASQFFFVLQGRALVATPQDTHELHEQQGIAVPPAVAHRVSNPDDADDLVLLVISSPRAHGDRVAV